MADEKKDPKSTITFRIESTVEKTLKEEAKEKGFVNVKGEASLNSYIPVIIGNRHNTGTGIPATTEKVVHKSDPEQAKKIKDLESIIKSNAATIANLEAKLKQKPTSDTKLADHFAKRAYEIAKISRTQLERGYQE